MKHLLLTTIAAVVLVGCRRNSGGLWGMILGPAREPFPTATIVVYALIAGLVVCVVCWDWTKNDDGWTPLHKAAYEGYREIVELLIAKGADVNAKNKRGMTPLHLAAEYGRNQVVELLIAKGTDVNAEDEDGETPLNRAIKVKQTDLADLLRKHGGKTGEELKAERK